MTPCELCGRPADAHDRHIRFRLPDPVLGTPDQDRAPGVWLLGPDAERSGIMVVPGVGTFVRALLPVRLSGGYTVTYGVWVAIDPADLQRTVESWWAPFYAELELDGHLANALPAWEILGAPVRIAVRDAGQLPSCVASDDAGLAAVLGTEWDHERVLATLPDA